MCFRMSRTLWFRLTQNIHVRTKKMHLNIFTYILCHATIQEHNVDKRLMTTHWWSYRTPNIQLHGLLTTPSPWKITWPSKSFFTYFSWKDKQRSHSKYHLLAMRFHNYLYCVGWGVKLYSLTQPWQSYYQHSHTEGSLFLKYINTYIICEFISIWLLQDLVI